MSNSLSAIVPGISAPNLAEAQAPATPVKPTSNSVVSLAPFLALVRELSAEVIPVRLRTEFRDELQRELMAAARQQYAARSSHLVHSRPSPGQDLAALGAGCGNPRPRLGRVAGQHRHGLLPAPPAPPGGVAAELMESLRKLYRIGHGPSSSHTMAPQRAASRFKARYPDAVGYRVTLYGSLAATGKGHMTDTALEETFAPVPVELVWRPDRELPLHPNGMRFRAIFADGTVTDPWQVYSLGGGALGDDEARTPQAVYPLDSFSELLAHCGKTGQSLWEYVAQCEGDDIWEFLDEIWQAMREAMARGLAAEGLLPGGLGVSRKAWIFHRKTLLADSHVQPVRAAFGLCPRRCGGERLGRHRRHGADVRLVRRAAGRAALRTGAGQLHRRRRSCTRWRPPA